MFCVIIKGVFYAAISLICDKQFNKPTELCCSHSMFLQALFFSIKFNFKTEFSLNLLIKISKAICVIPRTSDHPARASTSLTVVPAVQDLSIVRTVNTQHCMQYVHHIYIQNKRYYINYVFPDSAPFFATNNN